MSVPTKAERDELRRLHESGTPGPWTTVYSTVCDWKDGTYTMEWRPIRPTEKTWPDALLICAARNTLPGLLDYIDALEADLAEVRRGYCQLDKNWHAVHESAMKAIREAVGNSEATVPEIVDVISDSKQRIADLEAETDSLGVTADDEAEAHQETLFLLGNAKSRIVALEAALRPFATLAERADEMKFADTVPLVLGCYMAPTPATVGDCRHAREVVKEKA